MTLHTTMPLELVLNGHDRERPHTVELRVGGMLMEIEPTHPGFGRLVRLIDVPLDSYLRPELQPGSMIAYAGPQAGEEREPSPTAGGYGYE